MKIPKKYRGYWGKRISKRGIPFKTIKGLRNIGEIKKLHIDTGMKLCGKPLFHTK